MLQLEHKGARGAKMCFGFFDDDGVVACLPPVRRAIRDTVEALTAAGHTGEYSLCPCMKVNKRNAPTPFQSSRGDLLNMHMQFPSFKGRLHRIAAKSSSDFLGSPAR